jgi:hypothetical protein
VRSLLVAAVLAIAAASPAGAAPAPTIDKSPLLWATVNICDTAKHPDTIGIGASMPGSGRSRERMYMRFVVQYFRASTHRWTPIGASADSGFHPVGSARYVRRQAGRNFAITPPPPGATFRLRGVVYFEWRVGRTVVRKAQKRTRSGHEKTYGADPKGYSAAECVIAS